MFQMMTIGRAYQTLLARCLTFRTSLGASLLLLVALVVPGHAMAAACVTSFTVASSGSYQLSAVDCDTIGIGVNIPFLIAAPAHGTVTETALPGQVTGTAITYTNNGDGATSDSFTWQSSDGVNHTVSVTITPPASSITLSPASFSFTLGSTVSTSITASGGTAPYSYVVSSGSLPTGLSLSTTGALTGEVKGFGSYNFTVTATDAGSASGSKSYTGTIATVPPTISPSTLPSAFVNRAYSVTLTASGGVAPYTFSLDSSSSPLPAGVTLSSSGVISGTPTTANTYSNIKVDVVDSSVDMSGGGGINGSQQIYSLTVSPQPTITVSPTTLTAATVGAAYSQSFTASGGTSPYTYAVTSGAVPSGMSLSSSGALSGTPTAGGTFNFTVTATDTNNFTGLQAETLTVNAPTISVSTASLSPSATVGQPYTGTVTASGGTAPYTYAVTSGALPAGMSLSSSGTLSGTPTAGGTFNFAITATDSSSGTGPYSGTSSMFTLTVSAPTITLSPSTLPSGTDGSAYSQTLSASGGTAPYTYAVTSGALPTGLSLSSAGVLSGTPSGGGTYNFSVTATDSSTGTGAPFTGTQSYTLTVSSSVPVASAVSTTVAYDSSANPITLYISGGTPTSVAVASPASHGTATASGTSITYTPTVGYAGTDSFTYTASNGAGTSAPATVSIAVSNPTLTISASNSLTAQVGQPYTQTFTFSGGAAPYSGYSITGIPAGLSVTGFNNTSITLSGTPTVSGTFPLTVKGTDSSTGTGPFTVNQSFTLTINSASMNLSPGTLTNATVGNAYSQLITASGGIAPYTYAVTSGALPAGMSLSASGSLGGTPTAAGTFSFQVTATDSSTGAGSPATASVTYSLTVNAPTIALSPSTLTNATLGSAYSQQITASGGTAPYTYAVTAGALPSGMSLSASGSFSGTPTAAGSFSFTVTATDSTTGTGPFTGSQAYTFTVSGNPPVANDDTASTLSQQAVTVPVTSNDTGNFTSIAIVQAPAHGAAVVNGLSVVYTPTVGFSGADTFTYTDTGPGGTSAPATVTIQVNPKAIAPNLQVNAVAGGTVDVDLTALAQGGPFTAANLVSVTPSASGSGQIVKTASGYSLKFTPASSYSGVAAVTYTLSNAYSTSAPAVVSINVTLRPDPTKDPDVMGVLEAQTDSTRRFARGQIDNFNRRLEQLHGGGGSLFGNYLSVTFLGPYPVLATVASLDPSSGISDQNGQNSLNVPIGHLTKASVRADKSHSKFSFWVGGGINFGSTSADVNHSSVDFNTTGISIGADTRVSDRFAFGTGIGFGHGKSDVGSNGSRNVSNAYSLAVYGSFSPTKSTYLDGVLGYQRLFFDTRRYVAADGNLVDGNRHGGQVFGSLSLGQEQHYGTLSLSPYGRVDMSSAQLNAYTEQGDATYALHYDSQTVRTITGSLGLRANWQFLYDAWNIQPLMRAEYRHDFQGSSVATMSYADLVSGPVYQANLDMYSRNSWVGGIGLQVQNHNGLALEVEYQNQFLVGNGNGKNNSVFLNLKAPF